MFEAPPCMLYFFTRYFYIVGSSNNIINASIYTDNFGSATSQIVGIRHIVFDGYIQIKRFVPLVEV